MIIEYQSSDMACPGSSGETWSVRMAINLAFVTAANPFDKDSTLVSIVGRPHPVVIKEEFDRFMRSWQAAKR